MADDGTKTAYRRLVHAVHTKQVLMPLLHPYLHKGQFPPFAIRFEPPQQRPPDGWFHPSTHPLWSETDLYWYLTDPSKLPDEDKNGDVIMASIVGSAVHTFVQACLLDLGIAVPQLDHHGNPTTETSVADPVLRRRGHMDALLCIPGRDTEVFELKTASGGKINQLDDNDIEGLKVWKPAYYAQTQEYLDMGDYDRQILLVVGMGYPWTFKEFDIPRDRVYAERIKDKYRRVLEAVEAGSPAGLLK